MVTAVVTIDIETKVMFVEVVPIINHSSRNNGIVVVKDKEIDTVSVSYLYGVCALVLSKKENIANSMPFPIMKPSPLCNRMYFVIYLSPLYCLGLQMPMLILSKLRLRWEWLQVMEAQEYHDTWTP